MSKYKEVQTQFRNLDSLKKALVDIGFPLEQLQFAKDVQVPSLPLYGYHGDQRPERASIRIDRKYVGSASNDVGFAWDGKSFTAIISEFDSTTHFAESRLNQLKQFYAKYEIRRQANMRGYSVTEQRRTDGTIAMTLQRR